MPSCCCTCSAPRRRCARASSPAASTSCSRWPSGTLHMPHGTSLRMGRLGYQSDAQASLAVSYNSLDGYGASLQDALTRPYPPYEAIGIRNPGGEYNQLATSLLQIENEFYGTIRPKRVIRPGERPLHALRERGVEYVEVRLHGPRPFEPVGIDAQTMRFLDVFLLHCLLADSPPDTPRRDRRAGAQPAPHGGARTRARPELQREGREVALTDWGDGSVEELVSHRRGARCGARRHRLHADAVRAGAPRLRCIPPPCRRRGCWRSWRAARQLLRRLRPRAVRADARIPLAPALARAARRISSSMTQDSIEAQKTDRRRRHPALRGLPRSSTFRPTAWACTSARRSPPPTRQRRAACLPAKQAGRGASAAFPFPFESGDSTT